MCYHVRFDSNFCIFDITLILCTYTLFEKPIEPIFLCIFVHRQETSEVVTTEFLGVVIDNRLNWNHHIDSICNKVSKHIGIILTPRRVYKKTSLLLSLYHPFVYPCLIYWIHVWGPAYETYKLTNIANFIEKKM